MKTGSLSLSGWLHFSLSVSLGLTFWWGVTAPGIAGQEAAEARPTANRGHILPAAGGRLQFVQRGSELILPDDDATETVSVSLPPKWVVESAARVDGGTWISGRSNDGSIDDMFVASVSADEKIQLLPTPPGRDHPRGRTGLLLDRGPSGRDRVVGITWLEGASQQTTSVRAAPWNGTTWGAREVVAPPLGSEQTHLDSTVLADGSWLVVWAAVDGDAEPDDDIWWSRRTRGSWSAPQSLHGDNEVPDIHPLLAPADRGALVAWTAYDGSDYRVHVASFNDGEWTEQPFAGGKGAIPRRFVAGENAPALVYTSVIPETWNLAHLDASGRTLRLLEIPSAADESPLIFDSGADAPAALWLAKGAGRPSTATTSRP